MCKENQVDPQIKDVYSRLKLISIHMIFVNICLGMIVGLLIAQAL